MHIITYRTFCYLLPTKENQRGGHVQYLVALANGKNLVQPRAYTIVIRRGFRLSKQPDSFSLVPQQRGASFYKICHSSIMSVSQCQILIDKNVNTSTTPPSPPNELRVPGTPRVFPLYCTCCVVVVSYNIELSNFVYLLIMMRAGGGPIRPKRRRSYDFTLVLVLKLCTKYTSKYNNNAAYRHGKQQQQQLDFTEHFNYSNTSTDNSKAATRIINRSSSTSHQTYFENIDQHGQGVL